MPRKRSDLWYGAVAVTGLAGVICATVLATVLGSGVAAAQEPITLKILRPWPAESKDCTGYREFIKTVNERGKGKVKLTDVGGSEVFPSGQQLSVLKGGPGKSVWWDKVPSKFDGWTAAKFKKAGFRAVPNCVVRKSAFIAPGVVLMPSFVNLGAYVDSGTMVDTWATVGSCAQIGKNCHISGGAGIGGVLEPLQAGPVIIEDNCFIGAL